MDNIIKDGPFGRDGRVFYGNDRADRFAESAGLNRVGDSPANSKQHGGEHYQRSAGIQHWDFVHHMRLDYYQGNASKYLSRWRNKNGVQDLQKSIHYCEKALELGLVSEVASSGTLQDCVNFGIGYDMTALEVRALACIVDRDWQTAVNIMAELIAKEEAGVKVDPGR